MAACEVIGRLDGMGSLEAIADEFGDLILYDPPASDNCCCEPPILNCCACIRLRVLACVHLELTGAIVDSLDLEALIGGGICGAWPAEKDLGGDCSSQWQGSQLLLECDDENDPEDAVKFSIIPNGAECDISAWTLQSIDCGIPFSAVFTATVVELIPGGCDDCGGDGATITATFSECGP